MPVDEIKRQWGKTFCSTTKITIIDSPLPMNFLMLLLRVALMLRYKVLLKNPPLSLKGALILPNHPAEIDPVIMVGFLWNAGRPRPTVTEPIFRMPGLHFIFELINAFPMPDMEQGSGSFKRLKIKQTLENIKSALSQGDNILFYPSGRLSVDGTEKLLGASGAYRIVQETENVKVILVRIKGLWGSRFSKSHTQGVRPELGRVFFSSALTLIKNLLFFVPKREVEITFEEIKRESILSLNNRDFNQYLENFYHREDIQTLKLVPDSFISNESAIPISLTDTKQANFNLSNQKKQSVLSYLSKIAEKSIPQDNVSLELGKDLGFDSLQVAELLIWLQTEHDLHEVELKDLRTIGDIYAALSAPKKVGSHEVNEVPHWKESRDDITTLTCQTLTQSIITSLKKNISKSALHDEMSGVLTNRRVLIASLLLSKKFKNLPGRYIGVLLPSSGAALITIISLLFAKKVPVLLNWTAGDKHLQDAVSSLSISSIISSGKVLDRVSIELEPIQNSLILLEEIQREVTIFEKIISFLQTYLPARSINSIVGTNNISENEPAAVLFTSGSESTPKAVPLSHKNILSNIKAIYEVFALKKDDVILGFLPPFHSFGLTVTTLMPVVLGIRVVFSSNPNEASKLARNIKEFSVSLLAGTPTFLKQIFSAGEKELFTSLRLIVSGAEKLSQDLRTQFESTASNADVLEGYGITECSPVVAAQKIGSAKIGVGESIPSVSIKIVDKDTLKETSSEGLILVSGDSVFDGYLNTSQDPFIFENGIKWYNTGDLGYFSEGSLIISGRLKRFMKVGGEMISLPAIEDALLKSLSLPAQSIVLLDSINPETGKAEIVCFTTNDNIKKEALQEKIISLGFPALVKINQVKILSEIPVLGSGKTDIQGLKKLL